jgi:CDP-glycerol glycerophosphotransferase (TagB/SpsB family)
MHHGPGFGIQGTKMAIVDNHDIFFGLSNFERTMFEKIKPGVFSKNKAFFPIGFPKDDSVLGNSYDRDTLLKNLNLRDRPTILITSHWQDVSILRTFGSNIFRTLAKAMPDHNIIQTGHPWLWQPNKKLSAEWCDTLTSECLEIEDSHENALFLPDMSVEPLLFIADLLVADHSSVMTTYALLDRPIAFFDNPDLDFAIKQVYELYLDASSPFRNLEQLVDVCERAINNPDDKKMGRKTMRESFHSNYGMAGKAAADILRSIGCICSTNSKKWKTVMTMSDLLSH